MRKALIIPFAILLITACQTTDTTKWVANENTTAVSADTVVLPIHEMPDETPFELDIDPYAYQDIRPGTRPALESREAGIWLAMDKAEDRSKTAGNRIRDTELTEYISRLVCELSGPYCNDVRAYIMRVPAFNATMAPNGMMSVWTGLLLRMQNEAQLATVLGHEIGHYVRRHSIQRLNDALAKSDFATFFGLAAASFGVPLVGEISQLAIIGSIQAYSRDHEREADVIGINLMARNGYDTREAAVVWQLLINEIDPEGKQTSTAGFASSHPAPKERTETLRRMANQLQGDGNWGVKREIEFQRIVGPWKRSFLFDEIRNQNWDSTLRLLKILENAGHSIGEITFFRGEVYRKRNNEGDPEADDKNDQIHDIEHAREHLSAATKMQNSPVEAHRSLGLVMIKLNEYEKAIEALETYLTMEPNASDGALIRHMIQQIEETRA